MFQHLITHQLVPPTQVNFLQISFLCVCGSNELIHVYLQSQSIRQILELNKPGFTLLVSNFFYADLASNSLLEIFQLYQQRNQASEEHFARLRVFASIFLHHSQIKLHLCVCSVYPS